MCVNRDPLNRIIKNAHCCKLPTFPQKQIYIPHALTVFPFFFSMILFLPYFCGKIESSYHVTKWRLHWENSTRDMYKLIFAWKHCSFHRSEKKLAFFGWRRISFVHVKSQNVALWLVSLSDVTILTLTGRFLKMVQYSGLQLPRQRTVGAWYFISCLRTLLRRLQ